MHLSYEAVVFAIVVIGWFIFIRGAFRFFEWAGRQLKGGAAGANPVRQALADAQQQAQAPPSSQVPPPSQKLPTRAPALAPARPMPRQPQAGGPAVPREATERDFRRQGDELAAWETAAVGVALQSPVPPVATAVPLKALFGSSDDLVRAIILREALGPPLSRRRAPAAPPPTPSP